MIEPPVYISISEDAQFGGLLGKIVKFGTFGVVDLDKKKKSPGYDPAAVAQAVAENIKGEGQILSQIKADETKKYLMIGGAGLALLLLLKKGRRYG